MFSPVSVFQAGALCLYSCVCDSGWSSVYSCVYVSGWSSVVRVAAVACSDASNTALCRLYNIYGFPIVKVSPLFQYIGCAFSASVTSVGPPLSG